MQNEQIIQEAVLTHRKQEWHRLCIIMILIAICLISLVLDIATGPSMMNPKEVMNALLAIFFGTEVEQYHHIIIYDIRLPQALMAIVVGAALGAGGAEIQTLLNNPMASPYTLGLAAASGLGASLVIAFGTLGLPLMIAVPMGAFIMTMISSGILFSFAMLKNFSSSSLVLVGIALLFLFQSLLSLVQYLSSPEISQQILFWLFGSLAKAQWANLAIVFVTTTICMILLFKDSWALTALRLGEERAKSMGINLSAVRFKALVLVSIMTATAISFVGVIGFIGLVAPHIARMIVGEDQRFFLPMASLTGAAFLSIASVLSKVIVPGALFPVGIVTSFIGVPFFFWIILTRKNRC
ncbi:iron ABC transporter permease [Helicobacter monodelphidis]|uniref:FecCD family ABC transporter permease n=1 Tax=Helicobacter sp. 15-1451 TaxID=2004995 RepID=UPI000DCBB9B9|nr:iron ABC transporter permease [Helicobacter sp. 15-1451]RAX57711.1 iron ABC transporter permease [Helicobacter sp. 15-1451]